MSFTPKQARFLEFYLETWNATKAATAAGYSKKTAYSIGSELLKKPEIKAAIEAQLMTVDELGARLTEMGRGKREDIEPNHELKALELIGKLHGAFTEKHEIEHSGGLQISYQNDWRGDADN